MTTTRQTVTATQTDTIKAHLMAGKTISTWESYKLYQITCLAQRIHDLRSAGVNIQSKSVTNNGKRFSLYWINEEDRTRYLNGQVNMAADVSGTGNDVANEADDILASIKEVTKVHRANYAAFAAVNANDGVWLSHDYISNLLSALTTNAKALNLLAQLVNIESSKEADKINDCSMNVSDIAMSVTVATTKVGPHPDHAGIVGTWLAHDYLKQLKLSISGNANALGTMAIMAVMGQFNDAGMTDDINEAATRLTGIVDSLTELTTNDQ